MESELCLIAKEDGKKVCVQSVCGAFRDTEIKPPKGTRSVSIGTCEDKKCISISNFPIEPRRL